MRNITRPAQFFYAIALLAWGIQHLVLTEIFAGRPLVIPTDPTAKLIFSCVTGIVLVVSGLAITFNFKPRLFAAIVGSGILLWAAIPNIFTTLINLDYGYMLTNTNKALTMAFGGFLVAQSFHGITPLDRIIDKLAPLAKYFIGAFLFISGIQHFIYADFVKQLIPAFIPGSLFLTYFSGAALAAGGLGIITGIKRKLACDLSALMIFIWVFTLHLPRALSETGNANEWTAVFEALAVSGLLVLCGDGVMKSSQVKVEERVIAW